MISTVSWLVFAAVYSPSANGPGGKVGSDVQTLENWGLWLFFALCVMGVLAAGGKLMWSHHRGGGFMEGGGGLATVLFACAIGAGASGLVKAFT